MKSKHLLHRTKAKNTTDGSPVGLLVNVLIGVFVLMIMVLVSSVRGEIVSSGGVALPTNTSQYGSIGNGNTSSLGYSSTNPGTVSPSTDMIMNFGQSGGNQSNTPILVAQSNPTPVPIPAYSGTYQTTPTTSSWSGGTTSDIPNTSTVMGGTSPSTFPSTGNILQPSLQNIDPYGTPNQSSLFVSNSVPGTVPVNNATQPGYGTPYNSSSNPGSGKWDQFFPETYQTMKRFREATSFEYIMIPRGSKQGRDKFGFSEIDLRMQFSVPCRFIPSNSTSSNGGGYFYIAPGGSIAWWNGPSGKPDMSPNGFSAFVDVGVQPQFNEIFGLDAWFRFGVYSDFKKVKSDSLRYQGRLVGLFNVTPNVKIVFGAIYLDRVRMKALPTGGIVWVPSDDWILRLTFPNPKISKRLWNSGHAEWWGYATADYGGSSWYIDGIGQTDYNDIRVGVGLEFETQSKVNGHIEIGGSFDRELYSKNAKWASLSNAFYLKLGIVF